MPALRDLQESFAAAMFSAETSEHLLANMDTRNPDRAAAGIAAYRRSVVANLAAAVDTSYPVIGAIVGQEFMTAACRRYAQTYHSTSGDLNLYGHDFATFLANFPPAQSLPYLPDVARLEWWVQSVSGAADAQPQDLSLLTQTPHDQWGTLRFMTDPAYALLSSNWPVVRIWQINQKSYDGDFSVDFDRAQTALIHRRSDLVSVAEISPGDSIFLRSLSRQSTLDQAVTEAHSADRNFDLSSALTHLIANGLLRQIIRK